VRALFARAREPARDATPLDHRYDRDQPEPARRRVASHAVRVLLTPLGEFGHISPLIGICQRLVRDGHQIGFHCRRYFRSQLQRAGVDAEWFGEAVESGDASSPQQLAARMRDPRWLERWYGRALAKTEPEIKSIEVSIRRFRPDVLAVDPLNAAAAVVAERARLPWAALSTNFTAARPDDWSCPFLEVGERAVQSVHAVAAACGVELRLIGTDVVSPWFNSIFTTEQFAPRRNEFSHYIGPARVEGTRGDETPFPWERLDDRPLIYVASGGGQSLAFDADQTLRIARAVDPDAATMVIAAQSLVNDAAFRAAVPPHVIVVGYAPQQQLLERAVVAVIHGGVNSVNECLSVGCPMLVLPLGKEQPLQAELVRRAGVGLALDPVAMTDDDCRAALRSLLDEPAHRDTARAIRDSYQATDATTTVCAALAALVEARA
jgi:zeaxanthin glucosyltransferase